MFLQGRAKEEFNIEPITSAEVDKVLSLCGRIYSGEPDWIDKDNNIKTINFAKAICSEIARLTTLAIGVKVDGSPRAEWLQAQIDKIYFQLRHWVEYGCAYGTIILKPNGETVDLYTKDSFEITHQTGNKIDGVVFRTTEQVKKKYYTRLEYHRFENGKYIITNRCYVGSSPNRTNDSVNIKNTPWADLEEEVAIENVNQPLFGVFRTPHANNVDTSSPYALPIFSDAIEELKDLDVAYSRNSKEIADSKRTVLLDSDRLLPSGGKVNVSQQYFDHRRESMGLPDFVKAVEGNGMEPFYKEINPTLQTETRITGINTLLSQIGYKIGFSNGYFVFNEQSGIQTATGVEAEQQRTVQLVKDIRDKLESCLNGLIYALNVFADLYDLAPVGEYEITYDFGDITYNRDEDRARWYGYVTAGKIPFWMYLNKFEGYTEEAAKEIEAAATPKTTALFGGEI